MSFFKTLYKQKKSTLKYVLNLKFNKIPSWSRQHGHRQPLFCRRTVPFGTGTAVTPNGQRQQSFCGNHLPEAQEAGFLVEMTVLIT